MSQCFQLHDRALVLDDFLKEKKRSSWSLRARVRKGGGVGEISGMS